MSLQYLPALTQQIVDQWANLECRIPKAKQQKGYSNWIEGYLYEIEGTCTLPLLSPTRFPVLGYSHTCMNTLVIVIMQEQCLSKTINIYSFRHKYIV